VALHLDNWIIWDFWLAPRQAPDEPFHMYFLQAPRSIGDPELRHNLANVGHAISHDLRQWEYKGTSFGVGPPDAWDDFTIWTGSVIRHDDRWVMFYTGRNRSEGGTVQRIGLAVSDDLHIWRRPTDRPVLEPDPRWYQQRDDSAGIACDCRDPWVIRHDDRWLMYFTSSSHETSRDGCGTVGLATSRDLLEWEHLGPVLPPGRFGEVEVPQVMQIGDRWLLLFCTAKHNLASQRNGVAWKGTHYLSSASPYGPFELAPDEPLLGDDQRTFYGGRIVEDIWIEPYLMVWRQWTSEGAFAGDVPDPIPLTIGADGSLSVRDS
jgi:beta-fructofuranosidase